MERQKHFMRILTVYDFDISNMQYTNIYNK